MVLKRGMCRPSKLYLALSRADYFGGLSARYGGFTERSCRAIHRIISVRDSREVLN